MGPQIQDAAPARDDARTRFSFDQIGFVAAFPGSNDGFINFALNFQKKANYGHSLYTAGNLNGFTQAALLAGIYDLPIYNQADGTNTAPNGMLATQAYNAMIYDLQDGRAIRSQGFEFNRLTRGNLYGLDLNLSGNVQNRYYWGVTFGIDFLDYNSEQRYIEYRDGDDGSVQDYDILSNQSVSGTGINVKVGTVIRPIEDNPLRFGIAVETPTFYKLKQQDSFFSIASKWQFDQQTEAGEYIYRYLDQQGQYSIIDSPDDNYLEFNVHSPWKLRASIGSTYDKLVAWDVEYEYSIAQRTRQGYPSASDGWEQSAIMDADKAMNSYTRQVMRGIHNVRAGLEVKPVDKLALRAGYNFYSSPMKSGASLDQTLDSYALEYSLGTDYTNLSAANIFTFGIGYRGKHFYADMAYKYRHQSGQFYAFDDQFQSGGRSELQFQNASGGPVQGQLHSTDVNLSRHNLTFTLGVRF